MADFEAWRRRWQETLEACQALGGCADELTIGPPATEAEVRAAEEKLGLPLPVSLRTVFVDFAGEASFDWDITDPLDAGLERPKVFRGLFGGQCQWSLTDLAETDRERRDWSEKVFPLTPPAEIDSPYIRAYNRVWHGKLAVMTVPNGDFLALDLEAGEDPPVVYLSHDDGSGHGYRLGDTFIDFVDRWSLLGCPGPEDWQMLPFIASPTSGIDPYCENARLWRQWLGLHVE